MTAAGPSHLRALGSEPYDGERLVATIRAVVPVWRYSRTYTPSRLPHHTRQLTAVLERTRRSLAAGALGDLRT